MNRAVQIGINRALTKVGLKLVDYGKDPELANKYLELVEQVYDLYREVILRDLPENSDQRTQRLSRLWGTPVGQAIYILRYLNHSLKVDGDVCEFGVAQGHTSALLASEILETNKELWLFDSFEGLPKPTDKDILKDDIFELGSIEAYQGTMKSPQRMVRHTLGELSFPEERTHIVDGFIEETIKTATLPTRVSFAYVDFDFYEPTSVALNFLNETLSEGGCILVDDYNYFSTGPRTAVEELLAENPKAFEIVHPVQSAGYFCILKKL